MSELFKVSSNPHIRSKAATNGLMFAVVIALMPATGFGIYNFGPRALAVIAVTVGSTILTEYLFGLYKKKLSVTDLSAVVTGLLLALNLPVTIPLWMAALGGVFAILVVKMLFGGLGQNFMNPALAARCFLLISFLLGVIDLRIPGCYIVTFIIFAGLFGGHGFNPSYLAAQLSGGGLMLGAFFMATDYVTRPITIKGQYVFGVTLGLLTGIFRIFGPGAEGVSYAIILGNLLVPLIEKCTMPTAFGYRKGGVRHEK